MSKSSGEELVRTVLSEQIKETIIERILTKHYLPGDRLIESALAKELGVSQAPVREAIKSLTAMGFLDSKHYKGITVRSFSLRDFWEIYTVRALLESYAVGIAAERITPKEIEKLENILEKMVRAGEKGDIIRRTMLNIEFHETIIRYSGHSLILHLYQSMKFGSWSAMTGNLSHMDPVEMASRHRKIIDVLREGDSEKACMLMRQHIERSTEPVIESLKKI